MGSFKFKRPESKEEEHPRAQFTFDILYIPEEVRDVQYPNEMKESFDKLLVDILMDLVQKDVAEEVRVEHDSTDGEGDIDETFKRRVFYKINDPVSEE